MNCGPGNHNNNHDDDDDEDAGNEAHAGHFAKDPFENWFVSYRVNNVDPRGVGGLAIVAIQRRRSSLPYIHVQRDTTGTVCAVPADEGAH